MKTKAHTARIGLLAIFFSLAAACSHAGEVPANGANDGFTPLFTPESKDDWYIKLRNAGEELVKKVFVFADGTIHVFKDLPDGHESQGKPNSTHGLIYTKKTYSKFIFRFEYKWGKKTYNNFDRWQYDSGFYYHVSDDKIWPKGIEYQVRYDHTKDQNHTGDFFANSIRWHGTPENTFLLPGDGGLPREINKRFDEYLAKKPATFHALDGGWNQCEVIVMGDEYVIHKLNGEIVNMAEDLPFSEGIIGLQSETAEIIFRNMMIKESDEIIPMETFLK